MSILVSPAELRHDILAVLGPSSPEPESYGADFLILSPQGLVGIQRKEVRDLIASIHNSDRLQREIVQMEELETAFLIVEGDWDWNRQGISSRTGIPHNYYRGIVLSLQIEHGINVITTGNLLDTAETIIHLDQWFQKEEHGSLLRKAKSKVPPEIHILQHFPSIGLAKAKAIYNWFGRVPLRWDVDKASMMQIPGMGKVTVDKLWKVLSQED
jgi:ERCC4-type nuclease